jgi:hypothetical protein
LNISLHRSADIGAGLGIEDWMGTGNTALEWVRQLAR